MTFPRLSRVRIKSLGPYTPDPDTGMVVGQSGTVFHNSGLYVYVLLDGNRSAVAFRAQELEPLTDYHLPGLDGE
jgi:hypothetical protein